MIKHTLTAAALVAILASPVFAQVNKPDANQNSMPSLSTVPQDVFVQTEHPTDWRGSKLIGAIVYGPDNVSIGSVNDVLIGNDSKIRAVVIGVGGFLGVGEKNVAVPLESLIITRKVDSSAIDKIKVSYSKETLKAAPQFAYDEGFKTQTTGSNVSETIKSLNPIDEPKK